VLIEGQSSGGLWGWVAGVDTCWAFKPEKRGGRMSGSDVEASVVAGQAKAIDKNRGDYRDGVPGQVRTANLPLRRANLRAMDKGKHQ